MPREKQNFWRPDKEYKGRRGYAGCGEDSAVSVLYSGDEKGERMPGYQITEYCHRMIREHIKEGDCCVDATAGNGNDTEFLCRLTGADGKVYAFDIQKAAVEHTRKRLEEAGLTERAEVILDGHEHMENYVRETVSAITFNFGYLPGGDHQIATQADTSIQAIEAGLRLLKKGGIMSLCIYSGGDSGFAEKEALLSYLETLDSRTFLVIVSTYYNHQNHPPIPAFVIRIKEERGE